MISAEREKTMKILSLNEENKKNILENLLKRSPNQYEEQTAVVAEILDKVKKEKDAALFDYTKRFDKAELSAETIRVTDAEIAEAYEAWKKKQDTVGEELADIAIYLLGLSEILGIDLEEEIQRKVYKNSKREYKVIDGVLTRVKEYDGKKDK